MTNTDINMKRQLTALGLCAGLLLTLAGCSQTEFDQAQAQCIEAAATQLPKVAQEVDTSQVETFDLTEALTVITENPLPAREGAGTLYSTT